MWDKDKNINRSREGRRGEERRGGERRGEESRDKVRRARKKKGWKENTRMKRYATTHIKIDSYSYRTKEVKTGTLRTLSLVVPTPSVRNVLS